MFYHIKFHWRQQLVEYVCIIGMLANLIKNFRVVKHPSSLILGFRLGYIVCRITWVLSFFFLPLPLLRNGGISGSGMGKSNDYLSNQFVQKEHVEAEISSLFFNLGKILEKIICFILAYQILWQIYERKKMNPLVLRIHIFPNLDKVSGEFKTNKYRRCSAKRSPRAKKYM